VQVVNALAHIGRSMVERTITGDRLNPFGRGASFLRPGRGPRGAYHQEVSHVSGQRNTGDWTADAPAKIC
jgi:hypothetical protein